MTMYSAYNQGTTLDTVSNNPTTTPTPVATDFASHLRSTLLPWESRLLYTLNENHNLLSAIRDDNPLTVACDGSLEGTSGCFGWVIGTGTHICWTGCGPADGSPLCMSSQRTELYGILSALRFLLQFTNYHHTRPSSAVTLVCDNQSALKYAELPFIGHSAIQTSHPDYDIANSTLRSLPFQVNLKWVRGHQDRTKPYDELRPPQLNVHADAVAGEFQRECPPNARSRRQGPPTMPSCHAMLHIAGHHITGNHKQRIREASLLPALRLYLEERNDWTATTWDMIDWTSHGRCLATYSTSQRLTLTKFLHRWLPVGHQLAKLDPVASATCGACNEPDETDDHVCRCPHPEAQAIRTKARTALNCSLDKCGTDLTLRTLLSYGIGEWQDTETKRIDMEPPAEHPFYDQLCQAIADQNAIGWDQILRGRLAQAWGTCYISWLEYAPKNPLIKKLNSASWTTLVIKWAWDLVLSLWQHRNTLAHNATTEETTNALHLRTQLHVRDRYSRSAQLKDDYPTDVDFYFSEPLEQFLLKATHILTTWTNQVDRIFTKHRKEINERTKRGQLTHFSPANLAHRTAPRNLNSCN